MRRDKALDEAQKLENRYLENGDVELGGQVLGCRVVSDIKDTNQNDPVAIRR